MAQQNDFSQGSIPKTITRLAIPLMVAMLVNALYSVVDRIFIGHLPDVGQLALTGIGLCYPITMAVSAFSYLIGNGGAPLTSIFRGAGDEEHAKKVFGNSITLLVILGLLIPIVCLLIREPMLYLFGASDATYPYANSYITIYLSGSIAVMLTLGLNPFINAQGYTRIGMITVLIGAICNIALDPIFIYVLDMGVSGAAAATVISQSVSAVWVVLFFFGKKNLIRIHLKNLKLEAQIVKRILGLGFASFIMYFTTSVINAVLNSSLSHFGGDIYVTVMTIFSSVLQVAQMPINGFSQGAQPVIGYNFGAKEYERVKKSFWFPLKCCLGYGIIIWFVMMILPVPLISIFTNDPAVIATAVPMFRVYNCMFFALAVQMSTQNTYVALGKGKIATFFALFRKVILLIPLALILPRIGFGITSIFAAEPISDIISAVACFTVFMVSVYRKLK